MDPGIGAYRHVREHLGLETLEDALLEISKGKTTTAPREHTGEGIFFSSKAVDRYELEANGLRWLIDNTAAEHAVGESTVVRGTRVTWRIASNSDRSLVGLFDEYAIEGEFVRSRVFVKLAEYGSEFVSRSEAKRLAAGLDKYQEVVVDFADVRLVGQGFADELFRVWSGRHPDVALEPVGMSRPIEAMVRRALAVKGDLEPNPPPTESE